MNPIRTPHSQCRINRPIILGGIGGIILTMTKHMLLHSHSIGICIKDPYTNLSMNEYLLY